MSLAQTIREMDNLMARIEGINDERDLVPILLAVMACPTTGFEIAS